MTRKDIIAKAVTHIHILFKQFFKAALLILCFGSILLIAFHFMRKPLLAGQVIRMSFIESGLDRKLESKAVFKKQVQPADVKIQMVHYDNRYIVTYATDKDTATVYLHKNIYDTIQVGKWFEFNDNKGSFDAPVLANE